jgi:hypothetical protein
MTSVEPSCRADDPVIMMKKAIPRIDGCQCAWKGCEAAFSFKGGMPHRWVWLLAYWAPQPQLIPYEVPQQDMPRDAVLCPKHAIALERLLTELPRQLDGPPAGSA